MMMHWKLDETAGGIAHDSARENDGTVMGSPLWHPDDGIAGGALELDGIDDYVSSAFVLDPAEGAFSVFAWVRGGASGQVIVSQENGTNWLMLTPGGALMTDLKQSGRQGKPLVSLVVVTDGAWHRVGFVWDGSSRILYVDDVEVATDTQSNLTTSAGGLYIGAGSNLTPDSFWSGLIDDVRIYDRAVEP